MAYIREASQGSLFVSVPWFCMLSYHVWAEIFNLFRSVFMENSLPWVNKSCIRAGVDSVFLVKSSNLYDFFFYPCYVITSSIVLLMILSDQLSLCWWGQVHSWKRIQVTKKAKVLRSQYRNALVWAALRTPFQMQSIINCHHSHVLSGYKIRIPSTTWLNMFNHFSFITNTTLCQIMWSRTAFFKQLYPQNITARPIWKMWGDFKIQKIYI